MHALRRYLTVSTLTLGLVISCSLLTPTATLPPPTASAIPAGKTPTRGSGATSPAASPSASPAPVGRTGTPHATTSAVSAATRSAAPTAANTPTPTAAATTAPAFDNTAVPATGGVISAANAADVVGVARWGHGLASSGRYSPDGRFLAVAASLGVYLYQAATLQLVRYIDTAVGATDVAFSPDNKLLAISLNNHSIWLVDVSTGQTLRTLTGHTAAVLTVAFSPGGKLLASGGADDTARLWEVDSGNLLFTLSGDTDEVSTVLFLPDGQTLATGSFDNSIKLWDVATGQVRRTLTTTSGGLGAFALSPDGTQLAYMDVDESAVPETLSVKIWDANSGQVLHTLAGFKDLVHSLAFSPDGRLLAIEFARAGRIRHRHLGQAPNHLSRRYRLCAAPGVFARRPDAGGGRHRCDSAMGRRQRRTTPSPRWVHRRRGGSGAFA